MHNWNLDILYTSFNNEEFKNDFNYLIEKKSYFKNFFNQNNINLLEKFLEEYSEYFSKFLKIYYFCELKLSTNVNDSDAMEYLEKIENFNTNITEIEVNLKKYLKNLDNLDDIINSRNYLKEFKFYLSEQKQLSKHLLSDNEELLLEKMKNTGSKYWTKLQENLTANLLVNIEINGKQKQLPLSSIRNLAYDKDSTIRKKAYFAEIESYKNIESPVSFALNAIKGEAILEAKMRGYNSLLEKTLIQSRVSKSTLNIMFETIQENLKYFEKYLLKKAKILGHQNSLPFYDLFAPIGNIDKKYTIEEAKDFIITNFNKFSSSLSNYAKKAFDNNWVDFLPAQGKRGGAFCLNIHSEKESRIMLNFSGSFNDVSTLAHELGHGYHGEAIKNQHLFNSNYTMPIAETASIFCETIVKNAILKNASDDEKLFILEQDLTHNTQIIVDIYSRFLFEDSFIKEREKGSLSLEKINNLMLEAQKKAYGKGLDKNYLHKYMWICKPHYYSAEVNYYNFPYTFGLLFAKGLYKLYLEDKNKFIKKYDILLSITGKNNIEDIMNSINIDITKKEFWQGALDIIINDIEKFNSIIK
ncbi:pepF/M3 family oligoendopeptidase [Hypnocyclicus thermotrophus]|uniref:PepF/M3 family oligoendopeptidase n=1 Tax=Hypnocyclicus thermotrophus TaxID=1627895 RepID=A0AA46E0G4_9FUSO|nr:M3 family oligoendopeptidase [Hypnocyclicus thermotrophus]TDT72392.1 pepF/M3 family oligoendopeptidase [Hypnocyclicus thermotrophus]